MALLAAACGSDSGDGPESAPTTTSTAVTSSTSSTPTTTSTTEPPLLLEMNAEVNFEVGGYAFEGSAAVCDLESDGTLEAILVMSDDNESPSQIRAVDLDSGQTTWIGSDPSYEFYAQPLCHDLDGDGIQDVITGGWGSDVVALSGADGAELWTMTDRNPDGVPGLPGYSATSLRVDDLFMVTTTGNREESPGSIVAYDETGAVLTSWQEPSGAEIYGSLSGRPVGDGRWHLAVGSGGETLGGYLRILEWDAASMSFSELASAPSGCDTGGFNSSPVLVDADGDGRLDALGTDFCGTTTMLGGTGEVLWSSEHDFAYGTGNPALSDLDGDGTPEAIVAFSSRYLLPEETGDRGVGTTISAYRIADGEPVWEQTVDRVSFASPIAFDTTGDGAPEVVLVTARAAPGIPEADPDYASTAGLFVLDGTDGEVLGTISVGDAAGTPILHPLGADTGLIVNDGRRPEGAGVLALRLRGVTLDETAAWHGFRPGAGHEASWPLPGQ